MSLKAFHIFFVTISVLFSLGFSVWAFMQYAQVDQAMTLIIGVGAAVFAVALAVYGNWVWQKLGRIE